MKIMNASMGSFPFLQCKNENYMMKSLIRNKTRRIESQGILKKKRRKEKEINLILITEIRIDDNITQNVLIGAAMAAQDSSEVNAFPPTPSPTASYWSLFSSF